MSSRAFITGSGAVSPFGGGTETLWRGLLSGASALLVSHATGEQSMQPLVGVVPDGAVEVWLSLAERRRPRVDQYALAATREALDAARLDLAACDATRVAVVLATTLGAMELGEQYLHVRSAAAGPDELSAAGARRLLAWPYAATAATLARQL
ncbi:MAG: beta-ketoacyl synthase N-terminal-like domain-containing protein, partial [bacterium]